MAQREWPWPKEPTPRVIENGTWIQRHPTRYDLHSDVRATVFFIWDELGMSVRVNTYFEHPEHPNGGSWGDWLGYSTQKRSYDVWGSGGRGDPVGREKGQRALMRVFNDPNPPFIAWCIWRGWIWTPEAGWQRFNDDGTGLHFDHPHITFEPAGVFRLADVPLLADMHKRVAEVIEADWEDPREEEFWKNRPDDGGRYIKSKGLWVPVE